MIGFFFPSQGLPSKNARTLWVWLAWRMAMDCLWRRSLSPKNPGEKPLKEWVEMAVFLCFFVVFAKMFAYSASLWQECFWRTDLREVVHVKFSPDSGLTALPRNYPNWIYNDLYQAVLGYFDFITLVWSCSSTFVISTDPMTFACFMRVWSWFHLGWLPPKLRQILEKSNYLDSIRYVHILMGWSVRTPALKKFEDQPHFWHCRCEA